MHLYLEYTKKKVSFGRKPLHLPKTIFVSGILRSLPAGAEQLRNHVKSLSRRRRCCHGVRFFVSASFSRLRVSEDSLRIFDCRDSHRISPGHSSDAIATICSARRALKPKLRHERFRETTFGTTNLVSQNLVLEYEMFYQS